MKRFTHTSLLVTWLTLGALAGRAGAQDTVSYFDPVAKKEVEVKGTIEEGPAGLKVKPARGEAREIPALDVVEILYHTKVAVLDYRKPFGKERKALQAGAREADRKTSLAEALAGFRELAGQLKDNPSAHRYIQFKVVQILYRQAELDPAQRDAALAALTAYQAENAGSWEIIPCLTMLAQLQEQKGDAPGARKTYEALAGLPGVPAELKRQGDVQAARALLRGGLYPDAEKKLQSLRQAMPEADPRRPLVQALLAQSQMAQGNLSQAEGELKAAVGAGGDPALLATAHNLLGDYYRKKNQLDDAFWEYLRVDVLYPQDREEHAKALANLGELFDKVKKDPLRARQCLDRLKDKAYAGTEYQRRVLQGEK